MCGRHRWRYQQSTVGTAARQAVYVSLQLEVWLYQPRLTLSCSFFYTKRGPWCARKARSTTTSRRSRASSGIAKLVLSSSNSRSIGWAFKYVYISCDFFLKEASLVARRTCRLNVRILYVLLFQTNRSSYWLLTANLQVICHWQLACYTFYRVLRSCVILQLLRTVEMCEGDARTNECDDTLLPVYVDMLFYKRMSVK